MAEAGPTRRGARRRRKTANPRREPGRDQPGPPANRGTSGDWRRPRFSGPGEATGNIVSCSWISIHDAMIRIATAAPFGRGCHRPMGRSLRRFWRARISGGEAAIGPGGGASGDSGAPDPCPARNTPADPRARPPCIPAAFAMRIPKYRALATLVIPTLALAGPAPQVIHLWQDGAPGFEARRNEPEQARDYWVRNIHNPSVTVFLPPREKANGCAVVVAPGGGFRELVFNAEGKQAAEYLNSLGVAAFALKYRLPGEAGSPYTPDHVRQDAHRALRLVRSRAGEFNIDPSRVGILGFSAGGAVVMMVAFDKGDGDTKATRLNSSHLVISYAV